MPIPTPPRFEPLTVVVVDFATATRPFPVEPDAVANPMLPTDRATVVIAIATIFFFDDILILPFIP